MDQDTHRIFDHDGRQADAATVAPEVLSRLGFGPGGSFRLPGFIADPESGESVNPITDGIIRTATGEPVDQDQLPAQTAGRLADLVGRHRVNYGGQNTSASYSSTDQVLVIGGGAGGASEVEQATGAQRTVTWGARPKTPPADRNAVPDGPVGGLDPKHLWDAYETGDTLEKRAQTKVDLSFLGDGFNRRNTLPDIGAFALKIWDATTRTNNQPIDIRYTVFDRFETTGTAAGRPPEYDRIVFTIGQEAGYPGGTAALLLGIGLSKIAGQLGGELNGLGDQSGGLRVLGAAGVTKAVIALAPQEQQAALNNQIRAQDQALPPDARDHPEHPLPRPARRRVEPTQKELRMTLTVEAPTTVGSLMTVEEPPQNVAWLKQMLQHAVNREFATIPPYLYALWSAQDHSSRSGLGAGLDGPDRATLPV